MTDAQLELVNAADAVLDFVQRNGSTGSRWRSEHEDLVVFRRLAHARSRVKAEHAGEIYTDQWGVTYNYRDRAME